MTNELAFLEYSAYFCLFLAITIGVVVIGYMVFLFANTSYLKYKEVQVPVIGKDILPWRTIVQLVPVGKITIPQTHYISTKHLLTVKINNQEVDHIVEEEKYYKINIGDIITVRYAIARFNNEIVLE